MENKIVMISDTHGQHHDVFLPKGDILIHAGDVSRSCLLYTSDAADDSLRVDLGGRRIIKKCRAYE